jgi:DNA-binding winged helix-turn-helix (wHTH) protein
VVASFAGFSFDSERRVLAADDGTLLHLTPKAFDLLRILIDASPGIIAKAELHRRLWPATFVSDAALTSLVKELRRVLRNSGRTTPLIKTAHGIGYALDWPPTQQERETAAEHWLVGPRCRYSLRSGVNIIGREPTAEVWIDEPDVSRRHARIVIAGERAAIEDLGSKNGTTVEGKPVGQSVPLEDGDRLHAGGVELTYRRHAADGSTMTLPAS